MGSGLLWNDTSVYDVRRGLKILVIYLSDIWKYLDRVSAMIFEASLMFRTLALKLRSYTDCINLCAEGR